MNVELLFVALEYFLKYILQVAAHANAKRKEECADYCRFDNVFFHFSDWELLSIFDVDVLVASCLETVSHGIENLEKLEDQRLWIPERPLLNAFVS